MNIFQIDSLLLMKSIISGMIKTPNTIQNKHLLILKKLLNIAHKAHKIIGCRGTTRSDFKFYNNKFYLLEINTQPGMTSLSLVPEIAKFYNISFIELIEWIINDATINR